MSRISLPGDGQWVELRDADDIKRRDIRKVRLAAGAGETGVESVELLREAILTALIANWTLEQPIPSTAEDPADVFAELSRTVWYALEKIADDHMQDFGDPAKDMDKPADPPEPSEV